MDRYIVRQPVKDIEDQVVGYEILYNGGDEALQRKGVSDYAAADTIYNFLNQNSDKLFFGATNFMTFTPTLLFKNTPELFGKNGLVIQIEDNVIIHPMAFLIVQRYQKQGYQIAVNDFQFNPRYFSMLEYVDFIKLNIADNKEGWLENMIQMAHSMHKKCIVTHVESQEQYEMAHRIGADYLQGNYVASRIKTKVHKASYLKSNFFQLVVEITRDEPDLDKIEELIARDASLTYAILRMANSVHYAMRSRVSTVRQALVTIGLGQLKQWVYLMSCSQEEEDFAESEEFLRISFLRANFCARLATYIPNLPILHADAYLMGMFSTLNYLIDATMEEILAEVPVSDDIKKALISQEGMCGTLYSLVLSYERADWTTMTALAKELGIPSNVLTTVYFDCMDMVNSIWESISQPYADAEPEKVEEHAPNHGTTSEQHHHEATAQHAHQPHHEATAQHTHESHHPETSKE